MKQLFCFLLFLFLSSLSAQDVYYVNQGATGNADGSSWGNAFPQLQQALAQAQDGDEIWVAQGNYKPSNTNNRFDRFELPSGVAVYGGFTGTETLRVQRNWQENLTILSGDIGDIGDSTDNSYTILYATFTNNKTHLDGLIFEEGNANNTDPAADSHRPSRSGGGIYLDGELFAFAELSVANCIFRHNRALYQGGGIYANGREGGMAIVRLDHCVFEHNISAFSGGGVSLENYFEQPFALEVKACDFRGNYAISGGMAVWFRAHQAVTFTDCTFLQHKSNGGQTITFEQLERNHLVAFRNCTFFKNGNTVIRYTPDWQLATNTARFKFDGCMFSENGLPLVFISLLGDTPLQADFNNNIFKENGLPVNSTGFLISMGGKPDSTEITFTNNLFYKNRGGEIAVPKADIYNSIFIDEDNPAFSQKGIFWGPGPFNVSHSLFRISTCDSLGGNFPPVASVHCGPGNLFNVNPLFLNPSAGPDANFRLQPCSPAINAGTNSILSTLGISSDFQGNPRILNAVVDMGPYENHISLNPMVSAFPSCAGATNGSIEIDPNFCLPYSYAWNNGVTTGTNLDELAAGTYVFTVTGTNNIPVSDTILISEPEPLTVIASATDGNCFEHPDGTVSALAVGGTAPYTYSWDGIIAPMNLPAGTYTVTATDSNGCTALASTQIDAPEEILLFYTIHPASCFGCSDGSIVFDSIAGGVNPPLPTSMSNLVAGNYCITITDAVSCTKVFCFDIDIMSQTKDPFIPFQLKLSPNPTLSGQQVLLEWKENEAAALQIMDFQGKILLQQNLRPNSAFELNANYPPGVYQLYIRTSSANRGYFRWVIL